MQHVNVCLQALLKRLGKACREQEKEKEGGKDGEQKVYGEKHWKRETEKEKMSLCSV